MAYRLEPLFAAEFVELPPEQIPAEADNIPKCIEKCSVQGVTLALNSSARIDWTLHEDHPIAEPINSKAASSEKKPDPKQSCEGFSSHTCYFTSPIVAAFVQAGSAALTKWGTDGSIEDFLTSDQPWTVSNIEEEPIKQPQKPDFRAAI